MTTTIRPVSTIVLIGLSETNTIGYYTFINDKGETVRPRRPGTLEAITNTRLTRVTPLMGMALEVEADDLDEEGFYPRT